MTEMSSEDALAHFGVKGMKWGVRNEGGSGGAAGGPSKKEAKAVAKGDKAYERQFTGVAGYVKVHNAVADGVNSRIGALNDKKEYNVDMTKPENAAIQKKYIEDYRTNVLQKSIDEATKSFGTNASGTKQMKLTMVGEGYDSTWHAELVDVKHAVDVPTLIFTPKFSSTGKIISTAVKLEVPDSLAHGDDLTELLHYGVKGMQWGVRKEAIVAARGRRKSLDKNVAVAKKNYYSQTTKEGKDSALKALNEADKIAWQNRKTAQTFTRNEQVGAAALLVATNIMVVPAVAIGALGYRSRNRQSYKPQYTHETMDKIR